MNLQKFRWSKVYESSEEELVDLLASQNLTAERWEAAEFHDFGAQNLEQDATLYCADGSLVIWSDGKKMSLQPGDALRVPGDVPFKATAGITGCVCYEVIS
jgi:quercetin dioxygenase-like cupin family protein